MMTGSGYNDDRVRINPENPDDRVRINDDRVRINPENPDNRVRINDDRVRINPEIQMTGSG
jgi:hypothetical protein